MVIAQYNYYYGVWFILYVFRDDLPKLNYLTMCIKEVLRMYPLAVMFNKMSAEEIVTDEFRIPKGMLNN